VIELVRRRTRKRAKYLVIRAYYPKYDIQGTPTVLRWSDIQKHQEAFRKGETRETGIQWAKRRAREELIKHDVKPLGKLHKSHRAIIDDVEIIGMDLRKLDEQQVYHMRTMKTSHGLRVRTRVPTKRRRRRMSRRRRLR
jgi:hypothetical protein